MVRICHGLDKKDFEIGYKNKVKSITDKKLAETNLKIFHHILPCHLNLYDWKKKACSKCDVCDSVQSVNHLIYECPSVKHIWNTIGMSLGIDIDFRLFLIGIDKNSHLNELLSIIVYCIYKEWLHQSF